jgi:AraC-like DNA-binding protein
MPPPRRTLLIMHPNGAFQDRVRSVSAKSFQCQSVSTWPDLRAAAAQAPPSTLLLLDPYRQNARGLWKLTPELRGFLWEFPSITVVAAIDVRSGSSHDLRTLGEWGVADVISIFEDDIGEGMLRRLTLAQGRPLQNLLARSLPATVSGQSRTLLMTAAEVVSMGGKGRDLARALHLSQRTVLRWAERAGLPPPRRILAWMRILLASSLLDDPGRTVFSVACACGYASDSSLRRAMQDFLGTIPTHLRREGAFERATHAFLQELAEYKELGPESIVTGRGRAATDRRARAAAEAARREATK